MPESGSYALASAALIGLFDTVSTAAFLVDFHGRYRWVNKAYADLYGRTPESFRGEPVDAIDHADQAVVMGDWAESVRERGTAVVHSRYRHVFPNGFSDRLTAITFPVESIDWGPGWGALLEHIGMAAVVGERLEFLLEQAPIFITATDTEGRYTLAVGAALRDLGFGDFVSGHGQTIFDIAGTDDPDHPAVRPTMDALRGVSSEHRSTFRDRVLDARLAPLRDGAGEIVGSIAVVQDVTQMTDALTWSQLFTDYTPALVEIRAEDGTFTYANTAFLAASGLTREEVVGQRMDEVVHSDYLQRHQALDARVRHANRPLSWCEDIRYRNGRAMTMRGYRFPLPLGGGAVGVGSVCASISELTEAYRAARRTSQVLHALTSSAADGIVLIDAAGRIIEANPAAAALAGTHPGRLTGRRWLSFVQLDELRAQRDRLADLVAGRSTRADLPATTRRDDGTRLRLAVTLLRLPDADTPDVTYLALLSTGARAPGKVPRRRARLTSGERDVLSLVAAGRGLAEIAAELGLTRRGVDYRLSTLRRKLRDESGTVPANSAALVARAYAVGELLPSTWPPATPETS